ncbi:pyrroline-5-carboxylate reductase dimerization domain-containing protein [Paracoccus sp. MBLB3053]|uniref:Pyrroline-5-carboxylate reductase n=1 Tax=Paracoccus aurantius TaxID=3073814 RepID=A0ABU2HWT3_9RHOB|nr:pyrroline-5-carboxylate reductase dimerization domain-containing protein [Paracoccus sp. MBLB3053]MDS9469516.1 pyrroline-5-carboxylate reductase dimerization domain-containing protein [Paracoccus sp. MBLB3053]
MRLGIVGGTGWLGSALGRAVLEKGVLQPQNLSILNRTGPQDSYFGHRVHWPADLAGLISESDVIVLSIRPQDWEGLGLLAGDRLVISFMAGIGMNRLAACGGRILRAMPNAAAAIGRSYTPFVAAEGVSASDRATAMALLGAFGATEELPDEAQLDLMTAVSGAGPAYPALLAMVLAQFLTARGVAPEVAERAALNVVRDCPALIGAESGAAGAMVQTFLDYAGTTAAGLLAARNSGFESALTAGLDAALTRAANVG